MKRAAFAIVLVIVAGCGPSREIQYLQAAEEVKVEEKKLAELKAIVAAKKKEIEQFKARMKEAQDNAFDGNLRLHKLLIERDLPKEQYDAEVEKIDSQLGRSMSAMLENESDRTTSLVKEHLAAMNAIKRQQEIVDAAIARRDSFSVKAGQ